MDNLISIHISDNNNLKQLKSDIKLQLISESTAELFYKSSSGYLSIYNYGGISFINFSDKEKSEILDLIQDKISNPFTESVNIDFKDASPNFTNGVLTLPINLKADLGYRIVMFDVSQSVALDYYSQKGNILLDEMNKYAKQLELKGDLDLSKKEIMKFIGKSLVIKNSIIDTLYIFDSPDIAWEDENVDKAHAFLSNVFDLKIRYHEIETIFKVVDDNLETYKDIYQHKSSFNMELIVIILIAIEILNIAFDKFSFIFK